MFEEHRREERVDFDLSIPLMIMEPFSKIVYMKDASKNGLKIVTELELDLFSDLKFMNMELENSIPFRARVIWKKPLDGHWFCYGLEIED